MRQKLLIIALLFLFAPLAKTQNVAWPKVCVEARPAARWWWMGSAVDKENLSYNLNEYARAGMGTMEITPIYGVRDNEVNEIDFLSAKWMEMLAHTQSEAKRLGMQVDMNTGTGWPFGGPEVSIEDAASKMLVEEYQLQGGEQLTVLVKVSDKKQQSVASLSRLMAFSNEGKCLNLTNRVNSEGKLNWTAPKETTWRLIAVFNGKTFQKVKRAAPGGEGYVMDHFSHKSVAGYLSRFQKSFEKTKTSYPHNFFNDSYEVYKADWTPTLFEEFAKRRGYLLEEYLPEFLSSTRTEQSARIVADYRETISELLEENFTHQWTDWAHQHGSLTRNQAHGSPGNLIDLYATVDIPECESFGLSDFGIKGLRKDSLTRTNDSDLSMLKYASSAAHLSGKPYISSETFTWLTEHFRTSLSQCKPDVDLMFVSGVNHVYFHGTTYSPREAQWPGWKFYAAVDMSPTNNIWHDAPAFFEYITRCQSFLQMGQPDNDFLVYLPVYDMWHEESGRMLPFAIHNMAKRAPKFIDAVHQISRSGYDMDYISDNFIRSTRCVNKRLITKGGVSYAALVVPAAKKMPMDVLNHLVRLAKQGAKIVFVGTYPQGVPGYDKLKQRTKAFDKLLQSLPDAKGFGKVQVTQLGKGQIISGSDYSQTLAATGIKGEEMKVSYGLQCIRRSNDTGHHYFISSLQSKDVDAWISLGVKVGSAIIYDPLTGAYGKARVKQEDGVSKVLLDIKSGQSFILRIFANEQVQAPDWTYTFPASAGLLINTNWKLNFTQSTPEIKDTFLIDSLSSWTELPLTEAKVNMGTGCYRVNFTLPNLKADNWMLDLGDVRESARIRINGQEIGTLWSVPFTAMVGKNLKAGNNLLEVEVTNLPANRIADYDRRKVDWRIFKEINMVDLNYKKVDYGSWSIVPSGLLGPVKLIPMNNRAK